MLTRVLTRSQAFAEHFINIVIAAVVVLVAGFVFIAVSCQMNDVVETEGQLQARRLFFAKAPFSARIERVYVATDQRVKRGQLLVTFDVADLVQERINLEIELERLESRLFTQRIDSSLKDQDRRLEGESLGIERSSVRYLIRTQRRSLARTESTLREVRRLEQRGLLSQRDVNEVVQQRERILSDIRRHSAALRQLEKKSAVGKKKMARKRSESQELEMLRRLVKLLRRKKRLLERRMAEARVHAPYEGYIGAVNLERREGDLLQKGETVLMVYNPTVWRVDAILSEQQVRKVQGQQGAQINLAGYPSTQYEQLLGKVSTINNILTRREDQESGIPIRIDVDQLPRAYQGVRPGMAAQVRIIVRSGTIGAILWDKLKESLGQRG